VEAVNLLDSLLDAIVRLDGDALVMHVGEKPYVVTTSEATNEFRGPLAWGQVELSSRVLTPEAVNGMLGQILPLDQRAALNEYGATEFEVASATDSSERFTIVAARGGDDIWLEVRRHPKERAAVAVAVAPAASAVPSAPAVEPERTLPADVAESATSQEAIADAPVTTDSSTEEENVEVLEKEDFAQEIGHAVEAPGDDALVPVLAEHHALLAEQEVPEESETDAVGEAWGDDVMTEGDLGEMLRASAEALLLDEPEPAGDARPALHADVEEMLLDEAAADGQVVVAGGDVPPAPVLTPAEEALKAARAAFQAAQARELAGIDADREPVLSNDIEVEAEVPFAASIVSEPVAAEPVSAELVSAEPAIAHPVDVAPVGQEPAAAAPMAAAEATDVPVLDADRTPNETFDDNHPVDTAPAEAVAPEFAAATAEETTQPSEPVFTAAVPEEPAMPDDSRHDQFTETTPLLHEEPAASAVEELAAATADHHDAEAAPARHAVVLPLTRQSRGDADARGGSAGTLQRLLRLAAVRGAGTLYVVAQAAPMVRIDGEFSALDGEPALSTAFVEKLLAELAPPARDGAAAPAEWIAELPEIGRVRCVTFRDHRGPGAIFRIVPPRAIAAEQLGLPAEVQALSTEADGLVLVAGGRGSGRSTLLTSLVDLVNRTRSDYVITLESQIEFVHENRRAFISQREVAGDADALAAALRAAMREEPDVLVIEDLRTPELMALAIDAAESGRLVFGSMPAPSAVDAVERILDMFPAERRERAQAMLAASLRAVVSQVLLRRLKGGRVPAREVLLNTPAVASLIEEGRIAQLPAALENGRRYGMMPLAESLAALVRDGIVHPSHAQRKAPDKDQLVSVLRRDGLDSAVERLA
jgi:twitching motility protein PilT